MLPFAIFDGIGSGGCALSKATTADNSEWVVEADGDDKGGEAVAAASDDLLRLSCPDDPPQPARTALKHAAKMKGDVRAGRLFVFFMKALVKIFNGPFFRPLLIAVK